MKVFLVNLSTGSYSDHRIQNLAVFSDYYSAKDYIYKVDRTFAALLDYSKSIYQDPNGTYLHDYYGKLHPDFDMSKYDDICLDIFNDYIGSYEITDYDVYIKDFIVDEPDPYNKRLEALK